MDKNLNKYTEKDFLNLILSSESHLYKKSLVDTKILPFIMGSRGNFNVLDLSRTLQFLKKALLLIEEYVSNKGQIVLVCNCKNKLYQKELAVLKKYFIIIENDWPEGSFTNFSNTRKKSLLFKNGRSALVNNFSLNSITKKNNRKANNQIKRFFKKFQSIGFLTECPRLVVCLSPNQNLSLFNELKILNIPVISLTDNLTFTKSVDYPILCNNKDPLFLKFFLFLLKTCALKGELRFFSKFNVRKLNSVKQKSFLKLINIKNAK